MQSLQYSLARELIPLPHDKVTAQMWWEYGVRVIADEPLAKTYKANLLSSTLESSLFYMFASSAWKSLT